MQVHMTMRGNSQPYTCERDAVGHAELKFSVFTQRDDNKLFLETEALRWQSTTYQLYTIPLLLAEGGWLKDRDVLFSLRHLNIFTSALLALLAEDSSSGTQ